YIVMEHLEGISLAKLLADRGALSCREALRYAAEICEALVEAHGISIVHGDLKPENIYLTGGGDTPRRIKLLDFGVSRILNRGGAPQQAGAGGGGAPRIGPPPGLAGGGARGRLWGPRVPPLRRVARVAPSSPGARA